MHVWTHLKPESSGKTGLGIYADGMVEHDGQVGQLLAKLKQLGLDENTIVMYSTDNGPETFTWPDGGSSMLRGEKNTQYEGGYRVPTLIKWPGVIKPGTVINDIGSHEDMLTTLLAATGDTTIKEDLLKGRKVGGTTYKVHLDGYNLLPFLKGEFAESPHLSSSTGPTEAASRRCEAAAGSHGLPAGQPEFQTAAGQHYPFVFNSSFTTRRILAASGSLRRVICCL